MAIVKRSIRTAILDVVERRNKASKEDIMKDLISGFNSNLIASTIQGMVAHNYLKKDGDYYSIATGYIESFDVEKLFKGKENIR